MDQVAQLLQSMNATRPTELALQNDNRRLNCEVVSLQAELRLANVLAVAADKSIKDITLAYTVLKRGTMIKDMIAVHHDYVTADVVPGSDEHTCQITRLTKDTSATTDDALTTGVDCKTAFTGMTCSLCTATRKTRSGFWSSCRTTSPPAALSRGFNSSGFR